jgi:putative ABC transport system permease protein
MRRKERQHMFFRILKHSFLRERKRKTLAVVTVFFSASLITALMNLSIDVGDKMSRELRSYGANLKVVPQSEDIPLEIGGIDYNPLKGQVFLEEKDLPNIKDIFWRHNIVGFAPFLKAMIETMPEGTNSRQRPLPWIGTFFYKHLPLPDEDDYHTGVREIFPYWQVKGDWSDDASASEILVGARLAQDTGWKTGTRLQVVASTGQAVEAMFEIKGVLSTGGPEESAIVAPLAVVQQLTGLQGKVQSISVSALTVPEDALARRAYRDPDSLNSKDYDIWYCTAYVSSIAYQLEEAVPNSTADPIWQVAASEGIIIRKIQLLMVVVTLAAFVASGLGISSLMTTAIMERAREIGLMKALGAADWEVYLLFLSEAAVVGVIGGLLGWLAGTGLSQIIGLRIFGTTVTVSVVVIPVIVVLSVLITLAGSLMPSRLITKLYPAEVLHGRK